MVRSRRISARELRGQVTVLALALWATTLVNAWTPTLYLRSGQVKGTDFVHFYTLARLASEGQYAALLDSAAIRARQLVLVPESKQDVYPALYGPQVGVMLSPLGRLSYPAALLAWSVLTVAAYLALVAFVARQTPGMRAEWRLALVAAVAFPPFWLLVQHGHPTIVAVAALVLAWAALRRRAPVVAGLCLGLLAYKPPLVAPVAAVLLLSGSWRLCAGLAAGALLQFAPAVLVMGPAAFGDYYSLLLELAGQSSRIVARPEQFHGWRGFWLLLVPSATVALVLYMVCAAITVLVAARSFRRETDPSISVSVLGLSIGMCAPHLYAYDLVVLAPVWVWLTAWYLREAAAPRAFGRALYLGYVAPLAGPLAAVVRFQPLAPILLVLLLVLVIRVRTEPPALPARSA